MLPFLSAILAFVHTPTSVPTVSNISMKRKVKTTMSMSSDKTLSNSNWQKIGDTDSGVEMMRVSNSVTPIGIPIPVVISTPRRIAPGTFLA